MYCLLVVGVAFFGTAGFAVSLHFLLLLVRMETRHKASLLQCSSSLQGFQVSYIVILGHLGSSEEIAAGHEP